MGLSTIIDTAEFVADVYDPQRNVIHFIDSDGTIRDWSLATQSFTGSFGIGGPGEPTSMAITADGADLLIGISAPVVTSAPGAATTTYAGVVTRVNLTTHATDQIEFSVGGRLDGVAHIAVAADGTALVSTADFSGAPIQEFDAEATNPTVSASLAVAVDRPDYILTSSTAQHLIVEEAGSPGSLRIFSSGSDSVTTSTDLSHLGATGVNAGEGDDNEAKGLVVDVTGQNILVLHADTLALDQDLSSFQSNGAVVGADFDPSGDHLFLWDGLTRQIEVLDTTTWQEVGTLSVHTTMGSAMGQMQVIDNGQALMLQMQTGVELVDLTQGYNETTGGNAFINGTAFDNSLAGGAGTDTLNGQDGPDTLSGGDGDDSLSGGAGDDVIVGGAGGDTLSGGAGVNTFEFNQTSDSPAAAALGGHLEKLDHITDWTAQDVLQISGDVASTAGNFEATTSSDYASAESLAQSEAAGHGIHYLAAQIGSDVILFAPGEGLAVDLVGASLGDIGPSNIEVTDAGASAPPPDDGDGDGSGDSDPGSVTTVTLPPSDPGGGGGGGGGGGSGSGSSGGGGSGGSGGGSGGGGAVTPSGQAIDGAPGGDTVQAPETNDTITGGSGGANYLRGNGGDDSIQGGALFDDINGNKGNDTIDGGSGGSDWLVGGQGDNSVTAHVGGNILYGNLGNDTLHGGNGQDVLRGGQGDDVIVAGSGNQYISGDLGNDTETGGSGADLFHGSQTIGMDVITNFDYAKGDRVELDPGANVVSETQVGANTVIDMGGGNQMILQNVQLSSLPSDWIFQGTLSHL